MKNEFNLSNRISKTNNGCIREHLHIEDVKEFIKLLKENLHDLHDCENDFGTDEYRTILRFIDRLAGSELTK